MYTQEIIQQVQQENEVITAYKKHKCLGIIFKDVLTI